MGTGRGALLGGGAGRLASCIPPDLASKKLEGQGRVGGAWEGARDEWGRQSLGRGGGGEVRAKPPPQLLTEPEIPAERRRERQRRRETHTERALHTGRNGRGAHILGYGTPPHTYKGAVGRRQ